MKSPGYALCVDIITPEKIRDLFTQREWAIYADDREMITALESSGYVKIQVPNAIYAYHFDTKIVSCQHLGRGWGTHD